MKLLPLALALVCACDGGSQLTGEVRDPAGNPVPEATVTLAAVYNDTQIDSVTEPTGAVGGFSVHILHSPFGSQPLRLSVRKAGYRSYDLEFTAGHLPPVPIRVVLVPEKVGGAR